MFLKDLEELMRNTPKKQKKFTWPRIKYGNKTNTKTGFLINRNGKPLLNFPNM